MLPLFNEKVNKCGSLTMSLVTFLLVTLCFPPTANQKVEVSVPSLAYFKVTPGYTWMCNMLTNREILFGQQHFLPTLHTDTHAV